MAGLLNRVRTFLVALLLLAFAAGPAWAETVHGAVIAENARKVEDGRYRAIKDWDRTLSFYRRVYPDSKDRFVWRSIASTPRVRAVQIQNLSPKRQWEGINIYQTGGRVFIYVIPVEKKGEDEKKSRKSG